MPVSTGNCSSGRGSFAAWIARSNRVSKTLCGTVPGPSRAASRPRNRAVPVLPDVPTRSRHLQTWRMLVSRRRNASSRASSSASILTSPAMSTRVRATVVTGIPSTRVTSARGSSRGRCTASARARLQERGTETSITGAVKPASSQRLAAARWEATADGPLTRHADNNDRRHVTGEAANAYTPGNSCTQTPPARRRAMVDLGTPRDSACDRVKIPC